jgi:hypothetical protein
MLYLKGEGKLFHKKLIFVKNKNKIIARAVARRARAAVMKRQRLL